MTHVIENEDIVPKTPMNYFMEYFSDETNCYALMASEFHITKKEMKEIFGVSIMIGKLKFPRIHIYWESSTKVPLIVETINLDHYFKCRSNLNIVSQFNSVSEIMTDSKR